MNSATTIRIPVWVQEPINSYFAVAQELAAELGRPPTDNEITAKLKVTLSTLQKVQTVIDTVSLSTALSDEDERSLENFLSQVTFFSPEEETIAKITAEELTGKLFHLDPRERLIIKLRYGIGTREGEYTLEQIGDGFGLTRERIRQLEKGAMDRLRKFYHVWHDVHEDDHMDVLLFEGFELLPTQKAFERLKHFPRDVFVYRLDRYRRHARIHSGNITSWSLLMFRDPNTIEQNAIDLEKGRMIVVDGKSIHLRIENPWGDEEALLRPANSLFDRIERHGRELKRGRKVLVHGEPVFMVVRNPWAYTHDLRRSPDTIFERFREDAEGWDLVINGTRVHRAIANPVAHLSLTRISHQDAGENIIGLEEGREVTIRQRRSKGATYEMVPSRVKKRVKNPVSVPQLIVQPLDTTFSHIVGLEEGTDILINGKKVYKHVHNPEVSPSILTIPVGTIFHNIKEYEEGFYHCSGEPMLRVTDESRVDKCVCQESQWSWQDAGAEYRVGNERKPQMLLDGGWKDITERGYTWRQIKNPEKYHTLLGRNPTEIFSHIVTLEEGKGVEINGEHVHRAIPNPEKCPFVLVADPNTVFASIKEFEEGREIDIEGKRVVIAFKNAYKYSDLLRRGTDTIFNYVEEHMRGVWIEEGKPLIKAREGKLYEYVERDKGWAWCEISSQQMRIAEGKLEERVGDAWKPSKACFYHFGHPEKYSWLYGQRPENIWNHMKALIEGKIISGQLRCIGNFSKNPDIVGRNPDTIFNNMETYINGISERGRFYNIPDPENFVEYLNRNPHRILRRIAEIDRIKREKDLRVSWCEGEGVELVNRWLPCCRTKTIEDNLDILNSYGIDHVRYSWMLTTSTERLRKYLQNDRKSFFSLPLNRATNSYLYRNI